MLFRFENIRLEQFRGFEALDLTFEPDLTVLFGASDKNKTDILEALVMGIADVQANVPNKLRFKKSWKSSMLWTASIGGDRVEWFKSKRKHDSENLYAAFEKIRAPRIPRSRWPILTFYGVGGMGRGSSEFQIPTYLIQTRLEGYLDSLKPNRKDSQLLNWLLLEILTNDVYEKNKEKLRGLNIEPVIMDTLTKATPEVESVKYDFRERSPIVHFFTGEMIAWKDLPDSYHYYMSLVADITRQNLIMNEGAGCETPDLAEGVVLIDGIDYYLNPQWRQVVLNDLRKVFPKLQFIVTAKSPETLRSVSERHVRLIEATDE